jgi:single-strand DNA-binding protein
MILTALARLGRDPELRYLPNGDAVLNLALAVNYGKKGTDGNRPTQWIDAALFGKRAESLAPYLTKGSLVFVVVDEPHVETYQGKNGAGAKLVGRVSSIEFAGGGEKKEAPREHAKAKQDGFAPQPAQQSSGFGDMQDDVPFMNPYFGRRCYVV